MRLLTWLTIIYLAVLVVALALSLITIFVYLWRIGSSLALVQKALAEVETNTAPLKEHVDQINSGLVAVGEKLVGADENLGEVDSGLEAVAEHLGISETV